MIVTNKVNVRRKCFQLKAKVIMSIEYNRTFEITTFIFYCLVIQHFFEFPNLI